MTPDNPQAGSLAAAIRERLGPAPDFAGWPPVSIVVPSRDRVDLLRQLVAGLSEKTDYPELELIVVDNASSDDSLRFLRRVQAPFPISIVANRHNESFADACNQGAERARGTKLLFLNNDAEPFEPGWLRELVACLERRLAGAVGPTLIDADPRARWHHGYAIQQRGLRIGERDGMLFPAPRDRDADPLGEGLGEDSEPVALIAACLLIEQRAFARVGGFSSGYWYGPEDVDLALKLRERGLLPICSGRSVLIHRAGSTLATLPSAWREVPGNRRLFMERWGPRVRREIVLDRLAGGDLWCDRGESPAQPHAGREVDPGLLGLCIKDAAPDGAADAVAPAFEPVHAAIEAAGHRCLLLPGSRVDDVAALDHDAIVHLRASRRHVTAPGRLNVLWVLADGEPLSGVECARYDLVVGAAGDLARRLPEAPAGIEAATALEGTAPESLAAQLLAAVESRAEQIGLPTQIVPWPTPVPCPV